MPSRVMISIKKTPVPSTAMPATKVPLLHPFCVLSPRLVHSDLGNSRTKWSSIHYTISSVHPNSTCCQLPWDFTEGVQGMDAVPTAAGPWGDTRQPLRESFPWPEI